VEKKKICGWKPMDHLGGLGVAGRAILKCILKNQGVRLWNGLFWYMMDSHNHGNGCLGFRKGKKLLHQLSDCQILKKDSFSWLR
jgi:hypothetical protein